MEAKEVQIGFEYAVKVSGVIARVKVLSIDGWYFPKVRWLCENLDSGRKIIVKSARRFRCVLLPR